MAIRQGLGVQPYDGLYRCVPRDRGAVFKVPSFLPCWHCFIAVIGRLWQLKFPCPAKRKLYLKLCWTNEVYGSTPLTPDFPLPVDVLRGISTGKRRKCCNATLYVTKQWSRKYWQDRFVRLTFFHMPLDRVTFLSHDSTTSIPSAGGSAAENKNWTNNYCYAQFSMWNALPPYVACTWRHHYLNSKIKEPPMIMFLSSLDMRTGKLIYVYSFSAE